jgi:membrane-associated protease RseP (regulator of RpoE activity)
MFSTALNGLLLALLTILPTAGARAADDPKVEQREEDLIVHVDDDADVDADVDSPIVVRVGRGGFMGVRLIGITEDLRAHYGAPKDAGVLVAEVEPGSPAARAGIEVGDVITSVEGNRVASTWEVSRAIRRKKGGETVGVELVRGRSPRKVSVTLEERKGEDREIDLRGMGDKLRRHTWVFRDGDRREGDFEMPRFRVQNLDELPSLRDRLEELEKRVKDLERKLAR